MNREEAIKNLNELRLIGKPKVTYAKQDEALIKKTMESTKTAKVYGDPIVFLNE